MSTMKKIIKNNKYIYLCTYKLWSMVINMLIFFLKLFIKIDQKSIIINSFYSRKYNDSPLRLSNYLQRDSEFSDYKIYWVFDEPQNFKVTDNIIKIKSNSFYYLKTLLKSKIWITNSDINRFKSVSVSSNKHIYINTWHGVPLKYLGMDERSIDPRIKSWYKYSKFDLMCACSNYDLNIFKNVFPNSKNSIKITGLPRNDELLENVNLEKIRNLLNLPKGKKIVLFAPTYRDYARVSENESLDSVNILFKNVPKKVIEKFFEKYVVLYRGHYLTKLEDDIEGEIVDVTNYDNLNELMLISDVLISDYSSLIFDYSVLEKPIYLYVHDYTKYSKSRGMYVNIDELGLPIFSEAETLLQAIVEEKYSEMNTEKFQNIFNVKRTSDATENVMHEIRRLIHE